MSIPDPSRLVLWDIDGTLLYAAGYGWHLIDEAFTTLHGRPLGSVSRILELESA
jgi:phosphoglycolate phosphatase-like HAD superfamily hydrolase